MQARKEILNFMHGKAYRPMTLEELARAFDIPPKEWKYFEEILSTLEQEGAIIKTRKERYGIPEKMNLVVGRMQGHKKGFGFIIPDSEQLEDVYIGLEHMKGAMHNDRVVARLYKKEMEEKPEGEIIRILERANTIIVGKYEKTRNLGFVLPDESRLYYDVFIPEGQDQGARDGDKVVVKVEKWPKPRRNPEGRVIDILGPKDSPGVDVMSLIHRLNLPKSFPKKVHQEAQEVQKEIKEKDLLQRLDLRDRQIFTIDGADAKDFDDAISLENIEGEGVRLGVHIADVSEYVQEGNYLDQEAKERGTSVYLVDRVIPMLPEELSNDICSLKPQEDRLTITLFMDIHLETGEIQNYSFHRSVIQSQYRLTYEQVNEYLKGEAEPEDKELLKTLRRMEHLANVLSKNKKARGSMDFDFPEPVIILDDQGHPVDILRRNRGMAEVLIEEFMVKSNEVVAEHFAKRELPFIYRIHEQPDIQDIQTLNEFLHNFGFHIRERKGELSPGSFQTVLEKVKGRREERLIHTVLLRSLKQARYSVQNVGHFGLASPYYTHFTSPIRRYPDLIIHRLLKEHMERGTLSSFRLEQLDSLLPQIARDSSDRERRAMEGERESVDMKMVEYMEERVGNIYKGIISSVQPFGFFVELENLVEGLVHVSALTDDYYHYVEREQALIGHRRRKVYRLGDPVQIQVDKVNRDLNEIDFVVENED